MLSNTLHIPNNICYISDNMIELSIGVFMEEVKKSFDIDAKIVRKMKAFVKQNQGISEKAILHQALLAWFENPVFKVARPRDVSIEEMEEQMKIEKDILLDLAK